tara:strand:- start:53 stop:871 length:819 start_codon:yes stop_codon:yes gene_type:complete
MKTINSLSGGKTSSYLAKHYPTDYNIFSLIRIEDVRCKPKDSALIKFVSDKIGEDFIATAESDLTLYAVMDLEQLIGKEIIWVTGRTFEQVNKRATGGKGLPNMDWRFCTTEMKMRPIFDWCFKNIGEKVKMGIGFRYDELERKERLSTTFKGVVGKSKTGNRNKWAEIEWREGYFPLIDDKITHFQVKEWADKSGLVFPLDSNCVGCFHKPLQQLRKNWDIETNKMQWFSDQETHAKWKKETKYINIQKIGLQQDFNFGTGSGCQGGYCTD